MLTWLRLGPMRLVDANPMLFIIAGLCIFAVACFEIMQRQLGGPKVVEAIISEIWGSVRPRMGVKLLWLLLIPALLVSMALMIPGSN